MTRPRPGEAQVRVGVVLYRSCLPQTALSILGLERAYGPLLAWQFEVGADVAPSRNKIAAAVCRSGEKYALFLDGDMSFLPADAEALIRDLESDPKKGAISGLYVKWDGSELPVCNWRNGSGWLDSTARKARVSEASGGVVSVDSFGGGFLLVSTEALRAIRPPWFEAGNDEGGYYDADTGLCGKLQAAGFSPSVDFSVRVGHVGPREWRP